MNNKEFVAALSKKTGCSPAKTSEMIASLVSAMTDRLTDGDTLSIVNFGHFEVKKKAERLSVHPATQQRMLIPPKLVLTFRPSTTMKDKIK